VTAPLSDLPSQILVAIPALNEAAHIKACLRSLLTGDPSLAEVDMVVADGGSHDETRAIVSALSEQHANITLIDNPGRIQSAGVNAVVAGAKPPHKILVRCDAHAIYPPGYVLDVARQLIDRDVQGLATTLDAKGQTCAMWITAIMPGSISTGSGK